MIVLDSVTFFYPNQEPVFKGYDWKVSRGDSWAILGPSGCGKTTLLYLLAGLIFPNSGQILVDGAPLVRPRPHSGLILQEYGLLPWSTVRENAELGLKVRNFYGPDGKHTPSDYEPLINVGHWLNRLGIADVSGKYPGQISGGQRQRTAIARTLALEPDLLLMDEPFSSLDAPTREGLQKLTLELQTEQNLTLMIVTHAIEESVMMGKKILLLNKPPNTAPVIIDNPLAGTPDYRNSMEYLQQCRALRAMMEDE
jgi:NitT/TauT family transport system ATP-binding protein